MPSADIISGVFFHLLGWGYGLAGAGPVASQALQAVQLESKTQFPPGTLDDEGSYDLRVLQTGDSDKLDLRLLKKLMAGMMTGELSCRIKV